MFTNSGVPACSGIGEGVGKTAAGGGEGEVVAVLENQEEEFK